MEDDLDNDYHGSSPGRRQLECEICGSTHFICESGFYYCSECNTQSQQAREYVEDEAANIARASNVVKLKVIRDPKPKKIKQGKLFMSTWEIYNYVIKAMTDTLIEIGFPPKLRDKVFQLWTRYLLKREVVFCEANPDPLLARPAVSASEPKQNLVAQYNRKMNYKYTSSKNKKMVKVKQKKPTSGNVRSEKFVRTMKKNKAFEADYRRQQAAEAGIREEKPVPVRLTKAAKLVYRSLANAKREFEPGVRVASHVMGRTHATYFLRYERFTMKGVFTLLFLSLRQIGCRVLFTDIIRLAYDGTLFIDNLKRLMGEEKYNEYNCYGSRFLLQVYVNRFDPSHFPSYIEEFIKYVGLPRFRYPRFREFLPKFIDDCALPREFEGLLVQLNKMFKEEEDLNDLDCVHETAYFRDYKTMIEILILSTIGVCLKMLFGLDDVTERYQSRFAKTVNSILAKHLSKEAIETSETMGGYTLLFVIEDWFPYIRQRDALVNKEMYSPCMYLPRQPPNITKANDLINRYTENRPCRVKGKIERVAAGSEKLVELLKPAVQKSLGGREIPEVPDYLSIPLAKETPLQQYKRARPHNVSYPNAPPTLFNTNFSKRRIDYIFNPEKYIPLLNKAGYRVKIIPGDAINCKQPLPHREKTLYLFQPYRSFDDYIAKTSEDTSASMQFLINMLSVYIVPRQVSGDTTCTTIRAAMKKLGNLYARRSLNGYVPLPTSRPYFDNIQPEIELKHKVLIKKPRREIVPIELESDSDIESQS